MLTENRVINSLQSMLKRKPDMTEETQLDLPLEPEAPVAPEAPTEAPQEPEAPTPEPVAPEAPEAPPEVPEEPVTEPALVPLLVVSQLRVAGQGSDTPELHIGDGVQLRVFPLTNPVTPKQIADILAKLG
jgi:hypothetical protein